MTTFLDTSAILAVLDADEEQHEPAAALWQELVTSGERLLTSNYVLVECFALVQRRLGMEAVRVLQEDILPVLAVHWIDTDDHAAATEALLTAGRRRLSLVDCTSFRVMRRLRIARAFTLDRHFREQGFLVVPAGGA